MASVREIKEIIREQPNGQETLDRLEILRFLPKGNNGSLIELECVTCGARLITRTCNHALDFADHRKECSDAFFWVETYSGEKILEEDKRHK